MVITRWLTLMKFSVRFTNMHRFLQVAFFFQLIQVCSTLSCSKKWVVPLSEMKRCIVSFLFICLLLLVQINFKYDDFIPLLIADLIFCNSDSFIRKIYWLKHLFLYVFYGTMCLMLFTAKL